MRDFSKKTKTPLSQFRGSGLSGNYIPHTTTKSSHAATKDSTGCN